MGVEKEGETADFIPKNGVEKDEEVAKPNVFVRLLMSYYKSKPKVKSEKEIARDKWLIPGLIPFNRWVLLPVAVAMQFCLGSLFAWSVLNQPIDEEIYGENRNMAPVAFYIACGMLGTTSAFVGPWLERLGPRPVCILGATLLSVGNFLTGLAVYLKSMWLVYISYGVVGGFGMGLCYICPVATLQKWFPDWRGLASGFAVCGYGLGAIGIAKVQIPLIQSVGLVMTFVVLGAGYFVILVVTTMILRTPPPDFSVNGMTSDRTATAISDEAKCELAIQETPKAVKKPPKKYTIVQALLSKDFRLIYVVFISNTIFGLCAISRLSNMVTDIFGRSPEEASTVVAINGCFNLAGRLIFPILSDYIGRKSCYLFILTTQLAIVTSLTFITNAGEYWPFVGVVWLFSCCYGGGSGTIPPFLTDRFGPSNTGACHGVIMTAWSFAGVAGGFVYTAVFNWVLSTGYTAQDPHPYNVNLWWITGATCVGWIASMFITPTENDIRFRRKLASWCKCSKSPGNNDVKS